MLLVLLFLLLLCFLVVVVDVVARRRWAGIAQHQASTRQRACRRESQGKYSASRHRLGRDA